MPDTQYDLFRDLDRRCIAGGLEEGDCQETVRLKRASIESDRMRRNPIVQEVLAGKTTLVATYDAFSLDFRGIRRFLPKPHSPGSNERLRHLGDIVPNVRHFMRRSLCAVDNPLTGLVYGTVFALGIALLLAQAERRNGEVPEPGEGGVSWQFVLLVVCGLGGFVFGAVAMLKYRTRNPNKIHAREAAAYMDINYAYHRMNDDVAWARFIRMQSSLGSVTVGRPKSTR